MQIHWHDKQPVFSVDFHPTDHSGLFVSGGGDGNVRFWKLSKDDSNTVQYLKTLSRHSGAVNCVRFSPTGINLCIMIGQYR